LTKVSQQIFSSLYHHPFQQPVRKVKFAYQSGVLINEKPALTIPMKIGSAVILWESPFSVRDN